MLSRLILAFLARMSAPVDAAAIAAALASVEADVQASFDQLLIPQGFANSDGGAPALYSITPSGADSLLLAVFPGDTSPELTDSVNDTFAEVSTSPDATFLPDLRGAGFNAVDARDLRYLVAEYGVGASIKTGSVAILTKCARLAKLADNLAARI